MPAADTHRRLREAAKSITSVDIINTAAKYHRHSRTAAKSSNERRSVAKSSVADAKRCTDASPHRQRPLPTLTADETDKSIITSADNS